MDIDTLAKSQATIAEEIQRIVRNYTKDSSTRKNVGYLKERLSKLSKLWTPFEETNQRIHEIPDPPKDHAYFKTGYYQSVSQIYVDCTERMVLQLAELEAQAEESSNEAGQTSSSPSSDIDGIHMAKRKMRRQKAIETMLRRVLSQQAESTLEKCVKKESISHQWLQITELHNDILEAAADPGSIGYQVESYCLLHDEVLKELAECSSPISNNNGYQSISNQVQLPKIVLPVFNGSYLKWMEFHDLYVQLIHSQPISNTQKMYYLLTNLSGEAKALIHHLPISDTNYDNAWNILKNRYNNKRLLVTVHLNRLFSQPTIQIESAASIKALHDTTQECLLGLQGLGVRTESWDPIIVHQLIQRFDKTTHTMYEQSVEAPKEMATLETVLHFLETRFQALEALGDKDHRDRRRTVGYLAATKVESTVPHCILCKRSQHPLYSCPTLLALNPRERYQTITRHRLCLNCLRGGHMANNCTMRGCTKCSKKHNSLLHISDGTPAGNTNHQKSPAPGHTAQPPIALSAHSQLSTCNYVMLSTVRLKVLNKDGVPVECRAIIDSSSQLNFMTERLQRQLGLHSTRNSVAVEGIGQITKEAKQRAHLVLQSRTCSYKAHIAVCVLPQIASNQPSCRMDTSTWKIPSHIKLADPHFATPARVDLLLGAEVCFEACLSGSMKVGLGGPQVINTVFGWIVGGKFATRTNDSPYCGIASIGEQDISNQIERFWKIEEVEPLMPARTRTEQACEDHFVTHTKRTEAGRFIVRLPFLQDPKRLGDSSDIAISRFLSLERKLQRNPQLKEDYTKFIREYLELGHMQPVHPNHRDSLSYFIPHHCVLKPDSTTTRLRVVFDASAKTSTNVSLNELLHVGPALQTDLWTVLLRFRFPRFVFTADITKMYRQIQVDSLDTKYQCILWRDEPHHALQTYRLNTVTYGVTTAPYLAIRCLQQLAKEHANKAPLGAETLLRNFYVNDVMAGADSIQEALAKQTQLNKILNAGCFQLRKWCANHSKLTDNIPPEDQTMQANIQDDKLGQIKTLGITWLPASDDFSIQTQWNEISQATMRSVLADIAHLFDPLGIMGTVVVTAKMFWQKLWTRKLKWDSELPEDLQIYWKKFRQELEVLNEIRFPRHVFSHRNPKQVQLHMFADASELAYGAVIYVRTVCADNTIIVRVLCAKSKVAPIKKITLPRLELCAAVLATELSNRVQRDINYPGVTIHNWSDSEVVLGWINASASHYHTFVANRIAKIQEMSHPTQWRHVPSKDNPADHL